MHYYKRNLGDYAKKCGRLSMLEHGAYTLLIDSCYDREKFPTLDEAIDWCWARSEDEIAAVKFVLYKFFTLIDGVYVQKRIQEELADYHDKAIKNKEIATKREQIRKQNARTVHEPCTNRARAEHEPPPNQEPRTKNQEPINIKPSTTHKESTDLHVTLPTKGSAVCVSLRAEGLSQCNPQSPLLAKLIDDGAEVADFIDAYRIARTKSKGFEYTLGIVRERLKESKNGGIKIPYARASPQRGTSGRQLAIDNYAAQAAIARGEDDGSMREELVIDGEATVVA